jgi:20S proteasome subunit alpha 6
LAAIEETEQDTGVAPEGATTEADVELDSKDTSKDVPTSGAIPENQAATEAVVPTSASELVESTEPTPAENGHTETDAQATEFAEQAVPEVSIETNVEVPATTAEEAPNTAEPPKEDELPIPAELAAEVDQPTGEPRASTEVDPSSSADAGPSSTAEGAAESSTAVTDPTPTADAAAEPPATATPASAEETAAAIALSAENAASAYKSRTRRRSSVSSTDSRETLNAFQPEVTPSMNRLSILYEGSQRRMCFDAEVVERIEVWREEGRIEVIFTPAKPDDEENALLPKGYLVSDFQCD